MPAYPIVFSVLKAYFTQFETLLRHIRAYSAPCATLAYSEPKIYSELCQGIFSYTQNPVQRSHIENPAIFRILLYSEFWHIKDPMHIHSGIFNNDIYNNINFVFFSLILYTFQ